MSSANTLPYELEQYQNIRQGTLRRVRNLTQAQSEFRPRPGTWSAGEILDHLVKSQQLYHEQFEKLAHLSRNGQRPVLYLNHADVDFALPLIPKMMMPLLAAPLAVMNAFMPSAVRETLIRNRVLPAANPRASEPRDARPMDELRKALRDSMDSQESFFVANADLPFEAMRVCHPAMGYNNIPALLRISAAHEERHQAQLSALFKDARFPAAGTSHKPGA
jgi:DinB superfamily